MQILKRIPAFNFHQHTVSNIRGGISNRAANPIVGIVQRFGSPCHSLPPGLSPVSYKLAVSEGVSSHPSGMDFVGFSDSEDETDQAVVPPVPPPPPDPPSSGGFSDSDDDTNQEETDQGCIKFTEAQ